MGFGILFIGYIFTVFDMGAMFSDALGYLFMLGLLTVGWCVTAIGCFKLKKYIRIHEYAFSCSVCLSVMSAIRLVGYSLLKFDMGQRGVIITVLSGVNVFSALTLGAFFYFLLTGLSDICKETELGAMSKKALRLRASALVFSALDVLSCFELGAAAASMRSVRFVYYVVLVCLVAFFIFRCYMLICLPEDVDMKPKEKKKLLNKNDEDGE